MCSTSLALRHWARDRPIDGHRRRTIGRLADHGVRGSTRDRSAQPRQRSVEAEEAEACAKALTTDQTTQIRGYGGFGGYMLQARLAQTDAGSLPLPALVLTRTQAAS